MSLSHERDLEAKLLSWQHQNMHYCVSFLRYITGAKFQLQRLNISRDILDLICNLSPYCNHFLRHHFYPFTLNISKTRKDIVNKKTPFFFNLGFQKLTSLT